MKSNSGKYIDPKDNEHPYIAIDIRKLTDVDVNLAGMVTDDDQEAYIIYVDAADAEIHPDRVTPETASKIVTTTAVKCCYLCQER